MFFLKNTAPPTSSQSSLGFLWVELYWRVNVACSCFTFSCFTFSWFTFPVSHFYVSHFYVFTFLSFTFLFHIFIFHIFMFYITIFHISMFPIFIVQIFFSIPSQDPDISLSFIRFTVWSAERSTSNMWFCSYWKVQSQSFVQFLVAILSCSVMSVFEVFLSQLAVYRLLYDCQFQLYLRTD